MSKNEYISQIHGYVMIKHPTQGYLYHGPCNLLIHTGDYVWISACYAMEMPEGVKQVTDGRTTGFDQQGNCIYSIPVEWVARYMDDEEMDQVIRAIDDDERLLRYAQ